MTVFLSIGRGLLAVIHDRHPLARQFQGLVGGDWNMAFMTFHNGNRFSPTDELHHFQRSRTKNHQFQGDYVGIDKEKIEAVAGAVGSMAARARDWWGD